MKRLDGLTREKLYEKVWMVPELELADEFGVSDVAIAKHCKKLAIPRPTRNYWARVAAGESPAKPPLPPDPNVPLVALIEPIPELHLPFNNRDMIRAAVELQSVLRLAEPDTDQRVMAASQKLPRVIVSKTLIDRAAYALHVIVSALAPRGILLKPGQDTRDPAKFSRDHDELDLSIEERIKTTKLKPHEIDKRRPSWEWKKTRQDLTGRLRFSISTTGYFQRTWEETDDVPFDELLRQVCEGICANYLNLDKRHAESLVQRKREEEARQVEKEAAERKSHDAAIYEVSAVRTGNLMKAAEWYRLYTSVVVFIDECERRWRTTQSNNLTTEQQNWILWAKEAAFSMTPFAVDYPDPMHDGPFDAASVPFAGPYPFKGELLRPPTMPRIPPVEQPHPASHQASIPQPYPFWLKHQ